MTRKEMFYLEDLEFVEWYEDEINSDERPSLKYEIADKVRHRDLAYELGGYRRVAPTILCDDELRIGE